MKQTCGLIIAVSVLLVACLATAQPYKYKIKAFEVVYKSQNS
jgi:hypothetical protein